MARPYSQDLRLRVIQAFEANESTQPEIAAQFSIGLTTALRWWNQFQRLGHVEPGDPQKRTSPRALDAAGDAALCALLTQTPDATDDELAEDLTSMNHPITRSSVQRARERLGLTYKKKRSSPPNVKRNGSSS